VVFCPDRIRKSHGKSPNKSPGKSHSKSHSKVLVVIGGEGKEAEGLEKALIERNANWGVLVRCF
jgi:hypothetical protein